MTCLLRRVRKVRGRETARRKFKQMSNFPNILIEDWLRDAAVVSTGSAHTTVPLRNNS